MSVKLIAPKSVTETLAMAMEEADRFTKVVVVGETVKGDEFSQIVILSEDCSIADANYLIDIVKQYVLTVPRDGAADCDDEPEADT